MRKWPLVLATYNKGKVLEIKQALQEFNQFEILSCADFVRVPEVVEDGKDFYANALKKALALASYTGKLTLADDSGLEVDALNGQPGVYSARFAGEEGNDSANNVKLLKMLEGIPAEKRTARFKCIMVLADNEGEVASVQGICEGIIAEKMQGEKGFGYDPLFFLPDKQCTMAELSLTEKNQISHRGKALQEMQNILQQIMCNN